MGIIEREKQAIDFDKEMGRLKVNVIVRGISLNDANQMIENHFDKQSWPPANLGSVLVNVSPDVTVEIRIDPVP